MFNISSDVLEGNLKEQDDKLKWSKTFRLFKI